MDAVSGAEVVSKLRPASIDVSGSDCVKAYGEKENVVYDEKVVVDVSGGIQCSACHKTFTTKASLKRHEERSKLCVEWNAVQRPSPTKYEHCIIDMLEKIRSSVLTGEDETACRYCYKKFSSVGNLNKHFKTSIMCNQFAIDSFYKNVASLPSK